MASGVRLAMVDAGGPHCTRESLTVRFQRGLIPGEPGEKVDEECIHLHR